MEDATTIPDSCVQAHQVPVFRWLHTEQTAHSQQYTAVTVP